MHPATNRRRTARNKEKENTLMMTAEQKLKCHCIIHANAIAGAGVAGTLAQAPFTDIPILVALEITMAIELGAVFGAEIDKATAKGLVAAQVATLGGLAAFKILSPIPFLGNALNATIATTMIETVGWALAADFAKKYNSVQATREFAPE
jgi:uncharacterized protein (DUF697 family)